MADQDSTCGQQAVGELCAVVNRLGRILHCLQFSEGLNSAQWEALRYVCKANRYSRTPSALADYLGTTKGTASQTIKALESKGYLARAQDGADRRSVRLEITPTGQAALTRDPLKQVEVAAAELAPDVETAQLLLTRLIDGLKSSSCTKPHFGVCMECTHFCKDSAQSDSSGPHRCGLTGEPLAAAETRQICVSYNA